MPHTTTDEHSRLQIVPAYDRQEDLFSLFQEYTDGIAAQGADVQACLQSQHYDDECRDIKAKYGLPNGRLYLALLDGLPVGCAALTPNDALHCELKRFYVKPGYRGAQIGRSLLDRMIEDAKSIGYTHMRLDTFPFMTAAIRMYERYGFYYIERYNDNPAETALFMQLDLTSDRFPSKTEHP